MEIFRNSKLFRSIEQFNVISSSLYVFLFCIYKSNLREIGLWMFVFFLFFVSLLSISIAFKYISDFNCDDFFVMLKWFIFLYFFHESSFNFVKHNFEYSLNLFQKFPFAWNPAP